MTCLRFLVIILFITSCGTADNQEFGDVAGGSADTIQEEVVEEMPIDEVANTEPDDIRRSNPPCSSLAFGDGRGGDLWLPVSEGNGLPVYLLNGAWQERATAVAQLVGGGSEQGNFTGFNNPDPDGLRQHLRFTRSCER